MIGLDRQGWILVGFAVLFFTAVVVSVCGWILVWRTRRGRFEERAQPPEDDDRDASAEETAPLPPGNPLR
jgi:cbb3-type cytochrome oxidase subunit 3